MEAGDVYVLVELLMTLYHRVTECTLLMLKLL
jgi:hypothetical protein